MTKKRKRICTLSIVFLLVLASISLVRAQEKSMRGDIVSFFKPVIITADEVVEGDVVSFGGYVKIQGEVRGSIIALFSKARIEGAVKGDVVSVFGGITLSPKSVVNGDGVAVLGSGLINKGNIMGSEIDVFGFFPNQMSTYSILAAFISFLLLVKQVASYLVAAVIVVLFNDKLDSVSERLFDTSGKKILIGLLTYIGAITGGIFFMLTIIGAPLMALLVFSLLILSFVGNVIAKIAIGRKIGFYLKKKWGILFELLMGTLVYIFLEGIIIGKLVTFVFMILGVGMVVEDIVGK